ncbi:hypothetical protein [Zunongwangia pacifica]|uniref:Uncharacterized protein n=1 Tax=Zunongwangia pacifica TaxID=2911062 RepID=A0A9X2A421_9FLAO|nr:hypothetical protein [Zunongwangia pacifica]MCL6219964.1 hypothetical protein [Zunongwangia pacifica]
MIIELKRRLNQNEKLKKAYDKFELLKNEIEKKQISDDVLIEINREIKRINNFDKEDKKLIKTIEVSHSKILKMINKRLGITTKNYHQNNWMSSGMAIFGLPIGMVCYIVTKNPAFIPIGLPIGMAIGLSIGILKDKKVKKHNKQIQLEE